LIFSLIATRHFPSLLAKQPNFTPRKEIAGACSNNSKSGGSMVRGASQRNSIAKDLRFVKVFFSSSKI